MKFVFIVHPGSATSNAAALTALERIQHRHRELFRSTVVKKRTTPV